MQRSEEVPITGGSRESAKTSIQSALFLFKVECTVFSSVFLKVNFCHPLKSVRTCKAPQFFW